MELEESVILGKDAGTVEEAINVLEDEDGGSAAVIVSKAWTSDVELEVAESDVDGDPKVEATLGVDTTAVDDATAAEEDPPLASCSVGEPPPQFLLVGFPQPLPPATGHHSGSGSPGAQSGMGGEVLSSYSGL